MEKRPSQSELDIDLPEMPPQRPGLPPIIILLVLISLIVLLASLVLPSPQSDQFVYALGVVPARLINSDAGGLLSSLGQMSTLVSHLFVHAGWGHFFLNSLWLVVFGPPVAARLRWGSDGQGRGAGGITSYIPFLSFYFSTGIAASIIFILLHLSSPIVLIGASGALSAVMGAAMRLNIMPGRLPEGPLLPLTHKRFLLFSGIFIAMNLVLLTPFAGVFYNEGEAQSISWEVHIAGYVFGALSMPFFDRLAARRRETPY